MIQLVSVGYTLQATFSLGVCRVLLGTTLEPSQSKKVHPPGVGVVFLVVTVRGQSGKEEGAESELDYS